MTRKISELKFRGQSKIAEDVGNSKAGGDFTLTPPICRPGPRTPESQTVFAVEFVHPAGRIQDLLFAGIKRMAQGTHFYVQIAFQG